MVWFYYGHNVVVPQNESTEIVICGRTVGMVV